MTTRLDHIALFENPFTRPILGRVALRVLGLQPNVMTRLYSSEEQRRSARMSFDEHAQAALAAKFQVA